MQGMHSTDMLLESPKNKPINCGKKQIHTPGIRSPAVDPWDYPRILKSFVVPGLRMN
jgi:hypothetical protein